MGSPTWASSRRAPRTRRRARPIMLPLRKSPCTRRGVAPSRRHPLLHPAEGEFEHRARFAPAPVIVEHGRDFFRRRHARQVGKSGRVDRMDTRENLAGLPRQFRTDGGELLVAHDLAPERLAVDVAHEEAAPEIVVRRDHVMDMRRRDAGLLGGLHQSGFGLRD